MMPAEKNLQDQINQLVKANEALAQENARLRKQHEQSKIAYHQLLFHMKEMMRHRFGQCSERYEDPENPQQSLFPTESESLDSTDDASNDTEDTVINIACHQRKKRKRGFSEHLPRKEVIISVSEKDRTCSDCGGEKKQVGYDRSERLRYVPPIYEVIVELREKLACAKGCSGQMVTAAKPLNILPKAFFDTLFTRESATECNCNAHARRKFEAIAKLAKGDGLAKQAMKRHRELYQIERHAKDQGLMPDQRKQLRQEKSKPIMEAFKIWLDEHYPLVLPKSPLGQAMAYCLNHWQGLCEFLNDGRLEIDNNLTEQEIKPFVIARKNFLFCNSIAGAEALCLHFSMIRTAKKHGLDPYRYYVKLLKAIPHCKTVEDYEALLPWRIDLTSTVISEAA